MKYVIEALLWIAIFWLAIFLIMWFILLDPVAANPLNWPTAARGFFGVGGMLCVIVMYVSLIADTYGTNTPVTDFLRAVLPKGRAKKSLEDLMAEADELEQRIKKFYNKGKS